MSPADMIDKITLQQLLGPLYQLNLPFITKALQGHFQIFERDITLPSGETRNTIATYTPEIENGQVAGFYVHVADITLVKNASLKLKENREDYFTLSVKHNYLNGVEHTLRSSLFTKFPGLTALCKQYFVSTTKLKKDFKARYQSTIFNYYRSLQMQAADKYIKGKIYSKKQLAEMFRFDNPANFWNCYKKYLLTKSQSSAIADIRHNFSLPVVNKIETSLLSISDRWKEKCAELEHQLQALQKSTDRANIGTWERRFDNNKNVWSPLTKKILELPPEFEPDAMLALNFYKKGKDRELAKKAIDEAFESGKAFDFQAQIITPKGNEKTVRVIGVCHFENNVCKNIYGTLQEIF